MIRYYDLEVVAKWQGTLGFGSITLRPPTISGSEIDIHRPWWVDRTAQGAPMTVDVSPEEFRRVEIGDRFRLSIVNVTELADDVASGEVWPRGGNDAP